MADDINPEPGKPDMPRPRRVLTEPIASPPPAPGTTSTHSEELVETLYSHPSVKIISFTSTQRTSFGPRPSSADEDRPGTLPASSRLERTIAVGPFRIYRAPGSVAFLSCGSALQPILPKSQCWCIDEDNSRFVLQIRRPQYWRIELPVSDPDDQLRALLLKEVLDKTLLFEKTHCPFKRSFIIELPEDPQTPVKKKAWTPEGKNLVSSPFSDSSPVSSPAARLYGKDRRPSVLSDIALFRDDLSPHTERDFSQYKYEPQSGNLMYESGGSTASEEREDSAGCRKPDTIPSGLRRDVGPAPQSLASNLGTVLELANIPWDIVKDNVMTYNTKQTTLEESEVGLAGARRERRVMGTQEKDRTGRAVHDDEGLFSSASYDSISTQPQAMQTVNLEKWEAMFQDPPTSDARKEEAVGNEAVDEPSSFEGSGHSAPINLSRKRISRMLAGRTYTAPSQLTVMSSSPSKPKDLSGATKSHHPPRPQPLASDESSPAGSSDSFHSVQSWHSPANPLPPSPPSSRPVTPSLSQFPQSHDDILLPRQPSHEKDNPAYTTTPDTNRTSIPSSTGTTDHANEAASPSQSSPANSKGDHVSLEPMTQPFKVSHASGTEDRPQARPRPRPHSLSMSRRALSPLPPPANFFSPPPRQTPQSRMATVRRLPAVIIHKTVELLLGPPAYLVNIMLKVAARILAGEWRGLVFGIGEGGEKIPVQWDYSDGELSDWSDDEDYASAKYKQSNSSSKNSIPQTADRHGSTEVDDNPSWEVD